MKIIDLIEHKKAFEDDEYCKRMSDLMTNHLDESKLLIFRWQERIEELQSWINLVEEFDNPQVCIDAIDKLSDEKRIKFANAITQTSHEINEELGYNNS